MMMKEMKLKNRSLFMTFSLRNKFLQLISSDVLCAREISMRKKVNATSALIDRKEIIVESVLLMKMMKMLSGSAYLVSEQCGYQHCLFESLMVHSSSHSVHSEPIWLQAKQLSISEEQSSHLTDSVLNQYPSSQVRQFNLSVGSISRQY
jgi:BioD-like phosphotransacetylase family protein